MHHDEGVNGFFLTNLLRNPDTGYRYDPTNYHGPTLYYLTLPVVKLFGLSTFAVRLLTAAFGVGVVWLVPYAIGLAAVCAFGQFGGTKAIPVGVDVALLAALSLGVLGLSSLSSNPLAPPREENGSRAVAQGVGGGTRTH